MTKSREVRVFISSSFRDMHGEREVLVKHVFPRLRQKCQARGVELTEIDLRWGLTEEQTQNLTDVVRVCLEEIDLCKEHPPFFISLLGEIFYFIGSSPDSTDYVGMLRYVMARLKAHYHIDEEIPTDPKVLVDSVPLWLASAHAQGRTILILDGLNQLTDNADNLGWLPEFIPSNVRLFLSTLEGVSFEALQKRGWQSFRVAPLSATERESLITKYLRHYHKGLIQQRVDRIVAARQTDNPLFLRVLLEELRIFGSHKKLDAQIDYYLAAPTVIDLYEKVLSRAGLLSFFHDYLRQVVEHRYLSSRENQQRWHNKIQRWHNKIWWNQLGSEWKNRFMSAIHINTEP